MEFSSIAAEAEAAAAAVVSVEWLHLNLHHPALKVLDGSWYMPTEQKDPLQEYQKSHIPGSLFFDIDRICDPTTELPHMLPSEEAFAAAVSALGIRNEDRVVVYDGKGIYSAPRVWWMFRVFGHENVWVLDGGMPKWRDLKFDVESSASNDAILKASLAHEAIEKVYKGEMVPPFKFQTKLQPHLVWTHKQIQKNMEEKSHQHVDARPKPRFDGVAPEPRKGIRSGHIPGSKCISFSEPNGALVYNVYSEAQEMMDDSQTLLSTEKLKEKFELEGISLDAPIMISCATGVTACILALGLCHLGKTNVPVYDGSWTEWVTHPDTFNIVEDAESLRV